MENKTTASRWVTLIAAFSLIGLGLLLLADNLFGLRIDRYIWPFFVIVPGAVMLVLSLDKSRDLIGLVFPGMIVTGTGLILFFQNVTGWWYTWSYMWVLYPLFVGLALVVLGQRNENQGTKDVGRVMSTIAIITFLCLGFVFEILIFRSTMMATIVMPVLLILVGLYLILRNSKKEE